MKLLAQKLGIEDSKEKCFDLVIDNSPKEVEVVSTKDEIPNPEDLKQDYLLARRTFKDLIDKGTKSLDSLELISKEAETAREVARVAEVMAVMMKTVSDTTKDMFLLQKVIKELKDEPGKKQETNINVDKAVFCGTTADLLKKIKAE